MPPRDDLGRGLLVHALPVARRVTRWQLRITSPRERHAMADSNAGPASRENRGSWTAAVIVGLILVVALLFTAYVLLWDGGGYSP
jgi:hypothetical protein